MLHHRRRRWSRRATARRFCQEGAHVVISDLDAEGVERIAAEFTAEGFTAHAVALDVTDDAAVSAAVAEAARRLGGLDTLVANAGILTVDRIEDLTPEAFRHTLEVNVIGTFLCIRHSVALLREAGGGAIVCTASQAGLEGVPEATAYCASKFGVVGIVQSLARELARDGIRVTGVAPGLVTHRCSPTTTSAALGFTAAARINSGARRWPNIRSVAWRPHGGGGCDCVSRL